VILGRYVDMKIKRWPLATASTHPVGSRDRRASPPDGRRFARVDTRRRARGFLLGLLADPLRKYCWAHGHNDLRL